MIEASTPGLAGAAAADLVSFLSPCVLPLVPAYVSYVAGQSLHGAQPQMDTRTRLHAGVMSLFFVLSVPFVLSAVFMRELVGRLKVLRHAGRPLQVAAGVVTVAMGVAMVTGKLTELSYWLLERFPVLGQIG